jgi:hypothetical protein
MKTRNQIDHVAVNWKWIGSLQDVKTRRGADVASDHELLIAKIKLSLRQRPKGEDRRKMAVHRLKLEEVEKEFEVKILNMFEVLQDKDVEDVEYWMEYRDALKETGEEVFGCVRSRKDEWISDESWGKINKWKEVKRRLNEELGMRQR